MKLRSLMFVLPNLFTVSSIFCGFYALSLCGPDATDSELYQAALAIFFGMFFDGFDGRVARLTKTQSDFGVELDSLADVVSFGAAPALMAYRWALQDFGFLGKFISFAFLACGALRLARFNVLARRSPHGGASRFFVGLPIPLAAGVLVSAVIANHAARGVELPASARVAAAVGVTVLALLMVSTVPYRTFKDIKFSKVSLMVFGFVVVGGVLIATQLHPAWVLVAYFSVYLVLGLVEAALQWRRRLLDKRAVADDDEDDLLEDGPDDVDEQEVL